ncbi:MAG: hypothetical protein NZ898_13995 [Myxococcota bacterium]|nr:hypothetical protein [Myxococcota bacterium]MDW8363897.1 hypothetical protein [Myxococcales bacterium]
MDENVRPAAEDGDLARLNTLLRQIAQFAPEPSWNEGDDGWAAIANRGAEAAAKGDLRGARASCKSCHQRWRKLYREQHRRRPVPATTGEPVRS